MSAIEPSWDTPLLSSTSATARAAYREGLIALVAGLPHAKALFERALALDPTFFIARVALVVTENGQSRTVDLPETPPGLTLGERQHVAVVRAHLAGDRERARDLRRQHLAELPGDLLVVWLPSGHTAGSVVTRTVSLTPSQDGSASGPPQRLPRPCRHDLH